MLTLARMIAPASRSFFTTNASSRRDRAFEQHRAAGGRHVGGVEVVLQDDRDAVERRARPLALRSASSARAVSSALGFSVITALIAGPWRFVGLKGSVPRAQLHELLRRSACLSRWSMPASSCSSLPPWSPNRGVDRRVRTHAQADRRWRRSAADSTRPPCERMQQGTAPTGLGEPGTSRR